MTNKFPNILKSVNNEKSNIDVVRSICSLLEEYLPNKPKDIDKYAELLQKILLNSMSYHDGAKEEKFYQQKTTMGKCL